MILPFLTTTIGTKMQNVILEEILNQEQKILRELNGRDYKDANLPDTLKNEIKCYHDLVRQYNRTASISKYTSPHYDIFPEKPVSRTQYVTECERDLSWLGFFNGRNYSIEEKQKIYEKQYLNSKTAEVMDNLLPSPYKPY